MSDPDQLLGALENVTDEPSFLSFLASLGRDRADEADKERVAPSSPWGPSANGWENSTVESFLLASVAWAVDSAKAPALEAAVNPWRRCADILYAGKAYE